MANYNKEPCFKITVMGCTKVGKTALINRIINKTFLSTYEPTTTIENYALRINLNEEGVSQKTYVNCIIEDTFGLDNSILNKAPELLNSSVLKKKRQEMTKQFKEIMFTSAEKKNKDSEVKNKRNNIKKKLNMFDELLLNTLGYNSQHIERKGFIFVCDCTNIKTLDTILKLIEKLQDIEKSNNLIYPKMLLFNMSDKVSEKQFISYAEDKANILENYRGKFKIDVLKVSAFTGQGVLESFKKLLSKVLLECSDEKQNKGIPEQDDEEGEKMYKPDACDKFNSCSKNVFCGSSLFKCNEKSDEEDEDDDD